MSLYTIRRFLFTAIPAAAIGITFDQLGQFVAGPLHMNAVALGWTLLLMSCGAWGWYADRIYDALFVRSKALPQSAAGEGSKESNERLFPVLASRGRMRHVDGCLFCRQVMSATTLERNDLFVIALAIATIIGWIFL